MSKLSQDSETKSEGPNERDNIFSTVVEGALALQRQDLLKLHLHYDL